MAPIAFPARRSTRSPRRSSLWRWVWVALCAVSVSAFADCTTRRERATETAFNARALAALVSALPPAPAGVVGRDDRPFDFKQPPGVHEVLCEDSKEGAFSISARRHYLRKHSEAERRQADAQYQALATQYAALRKLPPDKLAEQQALGQKANAAWYASREAEKAGDKSAAAARDAEYRSLRDQGHAIESQHQASVKPQTDEIERRRRRIELSEQRVEVVIAMNLKRLPVADERSVVGSHGAASPGQSAGLKVNNLAWSVIGVDGTLRQTLVAAIDTERLKAMVGKPPPSVAESEAVAARATPAVVPEMAPVVASAETVPVAPGAATTAAPSTPVAPAQAPAERTAAANPSAAASAPAAAPAGEPVKKAADVVNTVNKLRGLLGR